MVQINLGHPLDQSEAKIKPITASSSAFSRASENSVGFTLSSHRLFKIFSSPLIGRLITLLLVLRYSVEKPFKRPTNHSLTYECLCLDMKSLSTAHRDVSTAVLHINIRLGG